MFSSLFCGLSLVATNIIVEKFCVKMLGLLSFQIERNLIVSACDIVKLYRGVCPDITGAYSLIFFLRIYYYQGNQTSRVFMFGKIGIYFCDSFLL